MGTPLGSPGLEEEYFSGKGLKHILLLCFIKEVGDAGLNREAIDMVKGAAIPRLSHILKSIQKNEKTTGWMKTMERKKERNKDGYNIRSK